jgi:hypothetical protein
MRSLLSLWLAVALWLFPATAPRVVLDGGWRSKVGADAASLESARTPQRVDHTARALVPSNARGGAAPAPLPASWLATPAVDTADAPHDRLRRTERRDTPPRRLAFPVEATAPPHRLS